MADSIFHITTWSVKQADIRIIDHTQNSTANFDMLDLYYGVLSAYLINKEAIDIRSHTTQVR